MTISFSIFLSPKEPTTIEYDETLSKGADTGENVFYLLPEGFKNSERFIIGLLPESVLIGSEDTIPIGLETSGPMGYYDFCSRVSGSPFC